MVHMITKTLWGTYKVYLREGDSDLHGQPVWQGTFPSQRLAELFVEAQSVKSAKLPPT